MPEFSPLNRLVSAQPHSGWLEVHSFELDRYTEHHLALDNHRAVAPDMPGIGVEFDWHALKPFQAAGEPLLRTRDRRVVNRNEWIGTDVRVHKR